MAKKVAKKREIISVNKKYELMLILSPDLRESEFNKKLKEITTMIEKAGGKITEEDIWGKREFAYRIQKYNEGYYAIYNIELPNTFIIELKNHLRIEKDVLRFMIISIPEDYVYTKYDLEGMAKENKKVKSEPKKEVKKEKKSDVETKDISSKPKKEADKPAEDVAEKPKKPQSDLDKKLDEILDGDDLKL